MTELFKQLLEYEFYENIHEPLSKYIEEWYTEFNLERKTALLNEIMDVELLEAEVIKVYDFRQEDKEIKFNALVRAGIELVDYFGDETITDKVPQWFKLDCFALLDQVEIKKIRVDYVMLYNK